MGKFKRFGALVLVTPAAVVLAACSSSATSGSGSPAAAGATGSPTSGAPTSATSTSDSGSASPAGSTSSSSQSSGSGGSSTSAGDLGAKLQQAVGSVSSAHLSMMVTAAGQHVTASGDEKLSGGKLSAMDLTESLGAEGTIRVRIVDGKTYAQLPAGLNTTGKPWVLASATSSNPTIKALATSLQSTLNSASLNSYGDFAAAASNVTEVGPTTVDGVAARQYTITVDVTKLPATNPGKSALVAAGVTSLPVNLWLDEHNRPVKLTEQLTAGGQSVSTAVTLTNYNAAVQISAPPASQVGTE